MKRCAHCKRSKPLEAFSRASSSADGRQSWCKVCKAADQRDRYAANPEPSRLASKLRMRARRAADPVGMAGYIKGWRTRNADRVRARDTARRQRADRRAWQAAYWQEWKRRHPDRVREIARLGQLTRRARKLNAFLERVDPRTVYERDKGACGICGEQVDPERFDIDHVVPLSRGGRHCYANVQVAHPSCNYQKSSRLPAEMAA